jgi:type I restriction enzyme S subunit
VTEDSNIPEGYRVTELGELPKGWDLITLAEIAKINYGKVKPQDTGEIPVYGSGGIYGYVANPLINPPTIIIGRKGNAGKVWLIETPSWPSDTTFYLEWKGNPPDCYFIFNYLNFAPLSTKLSKTTLPSLQKPDLEKKIIPLPPLPEQHAIATTLRTVQEAREKTDAIIAATKALKVAMMKHLFTYGPVPPEEAKRVVLKETEIGEVPEGWAIKKIADVSIFQPGYAFKSEDYVDSGVKLFKISNVSFGITNWDDVSYLPSSYLNDFKQYQLKIGDLVIAMTRPIVQGGIKISRISSNDCPSLLNQRVGRFIPKSTINLDFLYQSLFYDSFIFAIGDGAGGSQQPNISGKQIERIWIPVPPLKIQNHIAIILSCIDKKLAVEQSRKEALDTLFSSLLHDLMTAKIRVKTIV